MTNSRGLRDVERQLECAIVDNQLKAEKHPDAKQWIRALIGHQFHQVDNSLYQITDPMWIAAWCPTRMAWAILSGNLPREAPIASLRV